MEVTMEQVRTAIENATKYRADDVIKLTPEGKKAADLNRRYTSVRDAFRGEPQATVAELTLHVANSPWGQKSLKTGKKRGKKRTVSEFIRDVALKAVGSFVRPKQAYGELIPGKRSHI